MRLRLQLVAIAHVVSDVVQMSQKRDDDDTTYTVFPSFDNEASG